MERAVFFDRDGIVNVRLVGEYVRSIHEFVLIDAVMDVLKLVHSRGYLPILVSNQQGVGKGLMTEQQLDEITEYFQNELMRQCGVRFHEVCYSTALEHEQDPRRKPAPGMILESAKRWNIDLSDSWMIGDSISDVRAGRAAGVHTILVGDYSHVDEADWIVPTVEAVLPVVQAHVQ